MKKRVLVLGSGGREDSIVKKLAGEGHRVYVIPGNGGTKEVGINVPIDLANIGEMARFARNNVHVTIVGPETILNEGIADRWKYEGLEVFGPGRFATQLEANKFLGNLFKKEEGIPHAKFEVFESYEEAMAYVRKHKPREGVVKANGLASGKGVIVCRTRKQIESAFYKVMVKREYGDAGNIAIFEKRLRGRELSLIVFYDGYTIKMLPLIQDHKRAHDGNKGPNTGGMGAIGPLMWVDDKLLEKIKREIVEPTIRGLKSRKMLFAGWIYFGIMVSPKRKKVWLLEYNMRLGDPEAQVAMALLETSLLDIVEACIEGRLAQIEVKWKKKFAVNLVLASEDYPEKVPDAKKEKIPIYGIEEAERMPEVYVYHSGTEKLSQLYTYKGKRVLSITALGDTPREARERAYKAAKLIAFDGKWYRHDIGIDGSW